MPAVKTREQRAEENARYRSRAANAGILKMSVMVPAERIPKLRATTLEWRREAKLLLEADRPSTDQILQIHGVCRTLQIPLPVRAFETRATASAWLYAHEAKLGRRHVLPRKRAEPS